MILLYYIFRGIAWFLARFPIPLLILISDLLKILIHYVFGYRKKIIISNLERSFPDKTRKEIRQIAGRFYRNLSDIILEVIKLEIISKEQLLERCRFSGFEQLQNSFARGRSVIIAIGHCGNWEWMATALGVLIPVKGYAIIKPLSNRYFNKYMEILRNRLNPGCTIPFRKSYRILARNRQEFISASLLVSDQTPLRGEITFWTNFLNQDTPFYEGMEKMAKSLDFDVVFMDIRRTGRMRYHGNIQLITNDPRQTGDYMITEKYIRLLENSIRENPDNWLWSHRRWKHRKPEQTSNNSQ